MICILKSRASCCNVANRMSSIGSSPWVQSLPCSQSALMRFRKCHRPIAFASQAASIRSQLTSEECNHEYFFRYTSGRWLWDEAEQFSLRYVKFNMEELVRIAAESVGSRTCVEIKKLTEGNFNKVFLLTMEDEKEVIAKVPNPNAGRRHFTTASEVATMEFARDILHIPAPKVYAWSSGANSVNAEYIIMEKIQGVELESVWEALKVREKFQVVQQVVGFEASFASKQFPSFGSLYYAVDVPQASPLPVEDDGTGMSHSRFAIGPSTSRVYFDDGRAAIDLDRGPWNTLEEYVAAIALREKACIENLETHTRPQGLFNGPRQYRPNKSAKLAALSNYLSVSSDLLPKEAALWESIMWHGDLHANNIFVHPERPTEVVGIIDWQSVHLSPLFFQVRHPTIVQYDGPVPEGYGPVQLPNDFKGMSEKAQNASKALQAAQTLFKLYEVQLRKRNEHLFRALQYCETLPCKVTGLVGSLFQDGEPIVNGLLMAVEKEWTKIVGVGADGQPLVPCPLQFTSDERKQQSADEIKWIEGVELMQNVLDFLGASGSWDGWVSHGDYDQMKAILDDCLKQFLDHEAKTPEERNEWIKAWPFRGKST